MEDGNTGCVTHGSVNSDSDKSDRARGDEADAPATEASVRAQLDNLALRVARLADDVERASGSWARPDLASALAGCQGLINTLTAVQDVAITRVAAIEEEWLEDGLVVESRRAPGHIALDAPDVVAGALRVSHLQAQRRVRTAVRLVTGVLDEASAGATGEPSATGVEAAGEPGEAGGPEEAGATGELGETAVGDAGDDRWSGMSGVHRAMRDGRLDGYSASVLDAELGETPGEVASAVLAAIEDRFATETPSALRQRCRRALARISPDLLRQRAQRAREECGLKRWAEAPGVDRWSGSFPSEKAAMGWAAVDALARRYVKDGRCTRLEQARGQALIDLVTSNATIDVTLVVTTAEASGTDTTDATRPQQPAPPQPPAPPEPAEPADTSPRQQSPRRHGERDRDSTMVGLGTDVGGMDGDLVEAFGPFAGDPLLVSRSWLGTLAQGAAAVHRAACHPSTGALLGNGAIATDAYRPGEKLKALVRSRDGRCRFPGCSVSARFCDLDHARPWPNGPTAAENLMCLCRRHHRIKQRPGWQVRLAADGTATWTDPVGRVRTTWPRNHLDLLALPMPLPVAEAGVPGAVPAAAADDGVRGEEASTLETVMEVLGDGYLQWPRVGQVPAPREVSVPRAVSASPAVSVPRTVPVPEPVKGTTPGDMIRAGPDHPRLSYRDVRERHRQCHRREKRRGAHQAPETIVDPPPF